MTKYEGNVYDVSVKIGREPDARYRTAVVGAVTLDDAIRLGRLLGEVTGCIQRSYQYILTEDAPRG